MIRILKQANFADSNIGNIDIEIDDTPQALAFVAKYSGIVAGSEDEAKAKHFINILVESGVYDKLSYLAVPMLASNVNEALQNVLLESGQPTPAANMTFENHGLGFSEAGNFGLKPYRSQTMTLGNYTMGMCVQYPNPWVNSNTAMSRNTYSHSNYSRIYADYYNSSSAGSNTPGYKVQTSNEYTSTLRMGSIDGSNNFGMQIISVKTTVAEGEEKFGYGLGDGGEVTALNVDSVQDTRSMNNTFIGGLNSTVFAGRYRLFFEALPMTPAEIIIMRDAIATLCGITI